MWKEFLVQGISTWAIPPFIFNSVLIYHKNLNLTASCNEIFTKSVLMKAIDQSVQLTKSIKSVSPKIFPQ